MEFPSGPGGEAPTKGTGAESRRARGRSSSTAKGREAGEVFDDKEGSSLCQVVDHRPSEGVEAGANPMSLSLPFPPEEATRDPTIGGLALRQGAPSVDMASLDRPELGKREANVRSAPRVHTHPVQGRFVGVEGDHRGWGIFFWEGLGVDKHHTGKSNVDLGHPVTRIDEDPAVIAREWHDEGGPFTASEGEAKFPGSRVEMERFRRNSEERGPDEGNTTRTARSEPTAVPMGERQGNVGGRETNRAGDTGLEGAAAGETREGTPRRYTSGEHLAEALVDEEAEVVHERADRERKRVAAGKEGSDQGAPGVHDDPRVLREGRIASAAKDER
jgi:hypothetical protein